MASLIEKLVNVLEQENEEYTTLVDLSNQKTPVLIRGDLKQLGKITDEEQIVVSRISNLDLSLLSVSQINEGALSQILKSANLPAAFESAFISEIASVNSGMTIAQLLSQTIVNVSISIISFLICFFVFFMAATFVIHLVQYVFELPVLRHLDALIGGVFGFVRGVLLLFILFALVPIVLAIAPVPMIEEMIAASRMAPMFDSQLILSILHQAI